MEGLKTAATNLLKAIGRVEAAGVAEAVEDTPLTIEHMEEITLILDVRILYKEAKAKFFGSRKRQLLQAVTNVYDGIVFNKDNSIRNVGTHEWVKFRRLCTAIANETGVMGYKNTHVYTKMFRATAIGIVWSFEHNGWKHRWKGAASRAARYKELGKLIDLLKQEIPETLVIDQLVVLAAATTLPRFTRSPIRVLPVELLGKLRIMLEKCKAINQ